MRPEPQGPVACGRFDDLRDRLLAELPVEEDEARFAEEHVRGCQRCAGFEAVLATLASAVAAEARAPRDELARRRRVEDLVAQSFLAPGRTPQELRSGPAATQARRGLAAAVMAVLGLAIGLAFWMLTHSERSTPPVRRPLTPAGAVPGHETAMSNPLPDGGLADSQRPASARASNGPAEPGRRRSLTDRYSVGPPRWEQARPSRERALAPPRARPNPSRAHPLETAPRPEAPSAVALLDEARQRRLAGDWNGTATSYRAVLAGYPESAEAQTARVSLGLLLLDRLGQPSQALPLFRRYLQVERTGTLAQEAAFGEIRALRLIGRVAEERVAIRRFLAAFPAALQGPALRRRLGALAVEAMGTP